MSGAVGQASCVCLHQEKQQPRPRPPPSPRSPTTAAFEAKAFKFVAVFIVCSLLVTQLASCQQRARVDPPAVAKLREYRTQLSDYMRQVEKNYPNLKANKLPAEVQARISSLLSMISTQQLIAEAEIAKHNSGGKKRAA